MLLLPLIKYREVSLLARVLELGDCYVTWEMLQLAVQSKDGHILHLLLQNFTIHGQQQLNSLLYQAVSCSHASQVVHALLQDPRVDPTAQSFLALHCSSGPAITQTLLSHPQIKKARERQEIVVMLSNDGEYHVRVSERMIEE